MPRTDSEPPYVEGMGKSLWVMPSTGEWDQAKGGSETLVALFRGHAFTKDAPG